MAGGSYLRALSSTFISELLSMNLLMAGMVPTVMALKSRIPSAADPTTPHFWFVMSMGLLVGFIVAYPMNWWLVANSLKHGMPPFFPGQFDAFGDEVVPILQERGIFRSDYAGTTLRDHLGLARPLNRR